MEGKKVFHFIFYIIILINESNEKGVIKMAAAIKTMVTLTCDKCKCQYQITQDTHNRRIRRGTPNYCKPCMKAYMLEKQKNFFNSLTPEQQKEFIDKRNWYARASEEVKHAHSQKTKDQLASRTKEEQDAINKKNSEELEKRLQQYSDRMREYNNSLSIDEKRSRARAMMDWHKSLTPEEKKALYYQTHKLHYSADDESYNQYADPRGKFSKIAYHKGSIHGKNSLHIHFEEEFNASNIFRDFYIVPELKVNYVISHHWDYGIYRKKTGELTFLVDLDGDYYHGGDGMDYDGIHSNERWDERRYFSIDPNMKVILHVIPECRFTEGIEELKQYVRLGSYDKIIDHRYKKYKVETHACILVY